MEEGRSEWRSYFIARDARDAREKGGKGRRKPTTSGGTAGKGRITVELSRLRGRDATRPLAGSLTRRWQ